MTQSGPPTPLEARASAALGGEARVPGDKSISHRALILGALAVGETRISGLLEGEDVLNTARAMRALGATVTRNADATWSVHGVGVAGFAAPGAPLDFGNSGTGCRLVMGAVAGCPITATFDGDASLRRRPMRRILEPLELMGARTMQRLAVENDVRGHQAGSAHAFVKRVGEAGLREALRERDAPFGDGRARVNGPEVRDTEGNLIED